MTASLYCNWWDLYILLIISLVLNKPESSGRRTVRRIFSIPACRISPKWPLAAKQYILISLIIRYPARFRSFTLTYEYGVIPSLHFLLWLKIFNAREIKKSEQRCDFEVALCETNAVLSLCQFPKCLRCLCPKGSDIRSIHSAHPILVIDSFLTERCLGRSSYFYSFYSSSTLLSVL